MSDILPDINFYYEIKNQEARVFNHTKNKFKTMKMTDVYKLKKRFFVFKGYECSDEGLKQYANDFFIWTNEIRNDSKFGFDYTNYKSHEDVILDVSRTSEPSMLSNISLR